METWAKKPTVSLIRTTTTPTVTSVDAAAHRNSSAPIARSFRLLLRRKEREMLPSRVGATGVGVGASWSVRWPQPAAPAASAIRLNPSE
jgi:hypothetical protein